MIPEFTPTGKQRSTGEDRLPAGTALRKRGSCMKILIVEDNLTNMKLVSDLLRNSDYQVLEVIDGETALQVAETELPDLILMDIQLPGMDGLTASRLLKNIQSTRSIPIVALTAFAMKGDEKKMLEAGCDAYIAKPIRYKELLNTVQSLLASGSDETITGNPDDST